MLAAFTMLVTAALVLMFPFKALVDRVLRDRRGDELTVSYLHNLLRTDPRNFELALRLAQQQLAGENFARMRLTLEPVLASSEESDRVAARMLLWRAGEREWRKTAPGSPQREALSQQLLSELSSLAAMRIDERTQLEIAERALDFGDRALAMRLYRALGRHGMQFDAEWFADRAKFLQGRGEYDAAIELFLVARDRASSARLRRTYFELAVRVLLSRNQPAQALALAERELGGLKDDLETLVFMVQLARSANKPEAAAKYARLMLRLSLLEQWRRLAQADEFSAEWRHVADKPDTAPATGPALPFDDRIYTLGYEAFVGSHELDDAYRVAESAVRQAPQNAAWRRRLAQVAEWSGRPEQAIVHWRWLVERREGDPKELREAAQALLRLAPGLFDDRALLVGLAYEVSRNPHDAHQLQALIAAYERIGEPEEGIALLQRLVRTNPLRELMQALADLSERAAKPELTITTLKQMNTRFGVERDRAMKLAALFIARGAVTEAYAELKAARTVVSADDTAFWRTFGSLAQRMQEDSAAREAYSRLVALENASLADFDALIGLLANFDPLQAGDLSMRAARRFNSWTHVMTALDFYDQAKSAERSGGVFAEIRARRDHPWLDLAESDTRFLSLRASYWRNQGKIREALADYQRWFALAPDDTEAREAILWIVIDSHNGTALKSLLASHETEWAQDKRLHDALGAAWLTFSAPRVALERYLTPNLPAHRDDFLWLMNYADALEQDQQADLAWRLRQKLWRERKQVRSGEQEEAANTGIPANLLREARARLAISQTPGDKSMAALRELLRLDRSAQAKPGAVSDELLLAWLMAQDQPETARSYLWSRYAQKFSEPQWATLALALANGDTTMAADLLERRTSALPRYDAVTAAQTIGAQGLAATLAFESQDLQRDDEPLQLQLSEALLDQASKPEVDFESRRYDKWLEREVRLRYETPLTPSLRMSMDLGEISRHAKQTLNNAPDERYANLAFIHRDGTRETRLAFGYRDAFASWVPVSLSQTLFATGTWELTLLLGWRQVATEGLALRALGWRNSIGLEGGYRLSADDRLSLGAQSARYYTQNGIGLGRGTRVEGAWSHSLRREQPESSAELFWSYNGFKARDAFSDSPELADVASQIAGDDTDAERVASLMPRGFVQYGARLTYGEGLDGRYSRALRPYASLALTYSTDSGLGYSLAAGFAGSVLGGDRLAAGISSEKNGSSSTPQNTTVGIRYWMAY